MTITLFISLLMNISLLTLVSTLLIMLRPVQKLLFVQSGWWSMNKIGLAAIFGLISILSTYIGADVNGALLNTRVIGVLAGGLIGGPMVGIITGFIAGLHRFLTDIGGFTAVACMLSTFLEGIIGAVIWWVCQKKEEEYTSSILFFTAFFAECLQMLIILVVAKPYESALDLIEIIALPMVLFNSFGLVVFYRIFQYIIKGQDMEEARGIQLSLKIVEQCLPFMRKSERGQEDWAAIAKIIQAHSGCLSVVITDDSKQLTKNRNGLLELSQEEMFQKKVWLMTRQQIVGNKLSKVNYVGAPMYNGEEYLGSLILSFLYRIQSVESKKKFTEGLAELFATQLALSELENQKKMRRFAEYQALQAQINPHFLFNSLNTISYFCREKPERARELILALSIYFRNTLSNKEEFMVPLKQEIEQVRAYLLLEEARFEERLTVCITAAEEINCLVPRLIIQPLVENAVNHGAMKRGQGRVDICITRNEEEVLIQIQDNGPGMDETIVSKLLAGEKLPRIGLQNVHKRLISIYGRGLEIRTSVAGTQMIVHIPKESVKE